MGDTKENDKRIIPISPALKEILGELRAEQRKVPNLVNRVFTRHGKPITDCRTVFELAREKAGVSDVVIHDLRHTAITRWAMQGMPQEVAMKVSDHNSLATYYRYANMQERHVLEAFKNCDEIVTSKSLEKVNAASY